MRRNPEQYESQISKLDKIREDVSTVFAVAKLMARPRANPTHLGSLMHDLRTSFGAKFHIAYAEARVSAEIHEQIKMDKSEDLAQSLSKFGGSLLLDLNACKHPQQGIIDHIEGSLTDALCSMLKFVPKDPSPKHFGRLKQCAIALHNNKDLHVSDRFFGQLKILRVVCEGPGSLNTPAEALEQAEKMQKVKDMTLLFAAALLAFWHFLFVCDSKPF